MGCVTCEIILYTNKVTSISSQTTQDKTVKVLNFNFKCFSEENMWIYLTLGKVRVEKNNQAPPPLSFLREWNKRKRENLERQREKKLHRKWENYRQRVWEKIRERLWYRKRLHHKLHKKQ